MKPIRPAWRSIAAKVALLLALLALQACALKFKSDSCSSDDDCFFDEICQQGTCQSLAELQGDQGLGGDPNATPAVLAENPEKGLSALLTFRVDAATPRATLDLGFCTNVAVHRQEADGAQVCDGGFLVRYWVNDDGKTYDLTVYRHEVGDDKLTDQKTIQLELKKKYNLRMQHDNKSYYAVITDEGGTKIADWKSTSETLTQYNEFVLINWTEAEFGAIESWLRLSLLDLRVRRLGQLAMNETFDGALNSEGPNAWCVVMPMSMMTPMPDGMAVTFSTLTQQVIYACISDRCPPDTLQCPKYHVPTSLP